MVRDGLGNSSSGGVKAWLGELMMDGWRGRSWAEGTLMEDAALTHIGLVTCKGDNGHAHCSRRSELTDYLGENPGGNLGTTQAHPCCWLTPIGP